MPPAPNGSLHVARLQLTCDVLSEYITQYILTVGVELLLE